MGLSCAMSRTHTKRGGSLGLSSWIEACLLASRVSRGQADEQDPRKLQQWIQTAHHVVDYYLSFPSIPAILFFGCVV